MVNVVTITTMITLSNIEQHLKHPAKSIFPYTNKILLEVDNKADIYVDAAGATFPVCTAG